MFAAITIAEASALLAATAAACVGVAAIWSNPRRPINRLFGTASLHVAAWLVCRYIAVSREDLGMYRVTTAVGALMLLHLWLIKETVANTGEPLSDKLYRGKWWLLSTIVLSLICFTQWFIPTPDDSGSEKKYGFGFSVFTVGLFVLFAALCIETLRQIRAHTGVRKLELQLLLFGGSATAILVILLMIVRSMFDLAWMTLIVPYVVLSFYAVTVVAITTSRVFDARQLLFALMHRACLVALVSLAFYVLYNPLVQFVSTFFAVIIVVAICLWIAGVLGQWLDGFLQYYPKDGSARQAALLAAQNERRVETLEKAFVGILKGWGHAESALITSSGKSIIDDVSSTHLSIEQSVIRAMRGLRWATPERISRERRTNPSDLVGQFMEDRQLGALAIEDGLTVSVLIGVGVGASRRPYTYPQIMQLMELATIMGSGLERVHFSAKVQHTEQLATVGLLGASLAHEIRNPLVTIKTFVQLLPEHYNDPRFRDKFFRLILDEVNRIDQLTDQLLDLASPRAYLAQQVELHSLLQASVDLVAAKAAHRQVELIIDFRASPDMAFTDASAARQVALNLCFNAIQAVDNHNSTERWVRIATKNTEHGIEMAVADSGPGIAPEIRPKLFQPFQTTKSTGFGLGLAICSDILSNLHASITVDPPESGRGATFRVTFPCQPL